MKRKLSAYLELTKPRILLLVLVTAAIGYFLGGQGIQSYSVLAITLLGTSICCGGAAALNHYIERDVDALMNRTKRRPIPSGIIAPADALAFGILLVLVGTSILVWKVNLLTGFLALLTAFLYALVYTPLKRITWLNTFIGAIPGALPPMGGWSAATGGLELGAWILFLILFVWQHPHFYSIAWMYREDYERGGFKMLPVVEPDGLSTFRQILMYSIVLLPISLLPTVIGMSGIVYFAGTLIMGLILLAYGVILFESKTLVDARKLLRATIVYLPVLLILIVADASF
jgi:protoheme IX farnesyltransferase